MQRPTNTAPPYAARRFWNAAYVAGCRITFGDGRLVFERSESPLLRIQRAGNAFGVFPSGEPVEPEPWILDGIEEHNGTLITWLSQLWPAQLNRFAWHVLVLEHELIPLTHYAAKLGHRVDGWCAVGGWIPHYWGKMQATDRGKHRGLPPVLASWKQVRFG